MTKVLLLVNLEQLAELESHHSNVFYDDDTQIFAIDVDVAARLAQLGYAHESIVDWFDAQDSATVATLHRESINTWFVPYEPHFQWQGISVLALERLTLNNVLMQSFFAKHIFQKIIAAFEVSRFIFFENQHQPTTWGRMVPDAVSAVWSWLAEQHGIPTRILAYKQSKLHQAQAARWRKAVSIMTRAITNPLLWQVLWRRKSKHLSFSVAINEAQRFAGLANALTTALGDDVLLSMTGARSSGGMHVEDLYFHSMVLVPGRRLWRLRAQGHQWYASWRTLQHTIPTDHPEIFQNPHLDYQFRYLFVECIPNALQTYEEAKTIFKALQTRVLVTTSIPVLYMSGVVAAAESLGLPVVTLPHSGVVGYVEYQTPGDYTITWTTDAAAAWKKQRNVDAIVSGLPPAVVSRGFIQTADQPASKTERKRITMLLANAQIAHVPFCDLTKHVEALQTLCTIPDDLRDMVQVVLKLHPRHDHQYFYQALIPSSAMAQGDVEIIREMPLDEILATTDLALIVNIPTSAYFLPLAHGVPLIWINTADYTPQSIDLSLWPTASYIQAVDTIWPRIRAALFDPNGREAVLQANVAHWQHTNDNHTNPYDVIVQLLRDLLAI